MMRETARAALGALLVLVLCGQLVAQHHGAAAAPEVPGRGVKRLRVAQGPGGEAALTLWIRGGRFDRHELVSLARAGAELFIDVARVSLDRQDLSTLAGAGPVTLWVTNRRLDVEDLTALLARGARVRVDSAAVPFDQHEILSMARSGRLAVHGAETRFSYDELAAFATAGAALRIDAGANRLDATELARLAETARQSSGAPNGKGE